MPPEKFTPMRRRLFVVFVLTLAVMSMYELVKQLTFPAITIWQSHILTIVFTSIIAVIIVYHPFRSLAIEHRNAVTEYEKRRRAEESALVANNKLNMLSSITRHDILNSLAVLSGYHELRGC